MITKIVTAILSFFRKPVPMIVSNVRNIVLSMTGNAYFTTPAPALAVVTTQVNDLDTAYALGLTGTKAQRVVAKEKKRILLLTMTQLKAYVQGIGNANPSTAQSVILSSGMSTKVITPRQKRVFTVLNTSTLGTVKVFCPRTKADLAFEFEYTKTPADEKSYVTIGVKSAATRTVPDLTSITEYWFRWAAITKDGRGKWSDPISITVT